MSFIRLSPRFMEKRESVPSCGVPSTGRSEVNEIQVGHDILALFTWDSIDKS